MFRYFMARSILTLGLYRKPKPEAFTPQARRDSNNCVLSYVVVAPKLDLKLRADDRVMVWCDPYRLAAVLHTLKMEHI